MKMKENRADLEQDKVELYVMPKIIDQGLE